MTQDPAPAVSEPVVPPVLAAPPPPVERRTPEGAIIRAALEHAKALAQEPLPAGHRIRVEATFRGDEGEIGAAWLTPRGWTLEGSAKIGIADRTVREARINIQIDL